MSKLSNCLFSVSCLEQIKFFVEIVPTHRCSRTGPAFHKFMPDKKGDITEEIQKILRAYFKNIPPKKPENLKKGEE